MKSQKLARAKLGSEIARGAKHRGSDLAKRLEAVAITDLPSTLAIVGEALGRGDIADRIAAANALRHGADYALRGGALPIELRQALPAIAEAAAGKDAAVRLAALRTLAAYAPGAGPEVVEAIIELDPAPMPANEAKQALITLRRCNVDEASAAVSWLVELLGHDCPDVLPETCRAVERLGKEGAEAFRRLVSLIVSDAGEVSIAATAALISVDPEVDLAQQCNLRPHEKDALLKELRRQGASGRHLRKRIEQFDADANRQSRPLIGKTTVRDLLFHKWYEDKNSKTFHSPAAIRDKWNRENPRDAISEQDAKPQGIDIVKKGLKRVKEFLDNNRLDIDTAIERVQALDGGK